MLFLLLFLLLLLLPFLLLLLFLLPELPLLLLQQLDGLLPPKEPLMNLVLDLRLMGSMLVLIAVILLLQCF